MTFLYTSGAAARSKPRTTRISSRRSRTTSTPSIVTAACGMIGGGWWISVTLVAFGVTFAFATLPRRRAQYAALYALCCFNALIVGETLGIVVPVGFAGLPPLRENYAIAFAVALFGTTMIVTFGMVQVTFVRVMRRARERYELLLQTAPDMILSADRDGVIVSANEAARLLRDANGARKTGDHRWQETDVCRVRAHWPTGGAARLRRRPRGTGHRCQLRGRRRKPAAGASPNDTRASRAGMSSAVTRFARRSASRAYSSSRARLPRGRSTRRCSAAARRRRGRPRRWRPSAVSPGGVAHDFNNLLTVIGTYCELLKQGVAEGNARRADVDEIYNATVRAAALTNQLLTFSRKQVLQPQADQPERRSSRASKRCCGASSTPAFASRRAPSRICRRCAPIPRRWSRCCSISP